MKTDEFVTAWEALNKETGIQEEFPKVVVDIAQRIKTFMTPENRRYQGATGNAKGLLDALKEYNKQSPLSSGQLDRYLRDIKLIIDYLLKVRLTSQVPLNTAFFLLKRLELATPSDVDDAKEAINKEVDVHLANYNATELKIASLMKNRIIDRCEVYGVDKIVIGTLCHSTVVCKTIIQAKDYIEQVVAGKTDPEQQGILTAYDLVQAGVPVKLINLEQYANTFRRVNMFLFGVDAVSAEGTVLNKTGTRMLATLAKTKELPVYFLGSTYKYARQTLLGGLVKVEARQVEKYIYTNHLGIDLAPYYAQDTKYRDSQGNPILTTQFDAFDTTKPDLYDAIVSEVGFLPMREAFQNAWKDYL